MMIESLSQNRQSRRIERDRTRRENRDRDRGGDGDRDTGRHRTGSDDAAAKARRLDTLTAPTNGMVSPVVAEARR